MTPTEDQKKRLRVARKKLFDAQCTCPPDPEDQQHGHDKFYLACERTIAEIEVDEALAAMGIEL